MKFGAFIVTYHRAQILEATLRAILRQSRPPELILVIDNGLDEPADGVVRRMEDARIVYHAMSHNAGPAGAARFGVAWFKEKGFDWAYWGDDDNPPEIMNTFERMFDMIASSTGIGIAGAVGQRYDFFSGRVVRLKDEILTGYLEVDVMAGASYMVINLLAINDKTLPDAELFFGFEELAFGLKIKKSGYRLMVEGDLMKEYRIKYNRLAGAGQHVEATALRQYYSTRNLIYIFMKLYPGHRHIAAYRIIVALGKIISGLVRGGEDGRRQTRYQWAAVNDALAGRMGIKKFDV